MLVDLFSGCGGLSLGAKLAGWSVGAAVDLDSDLTHSYIKNFPGSRVINTDVRNFVRRSSWNKYIGTEEPAGIIGGPPCQGFSIIGKRQQDDERNYLVREFYRQVRLLKPRFFLMENVGGILDGPSADYLESCIDSVANRYTIVGPVVINAKHYGAPTNRERVIVIGYRSADVDSISSEDIQGKTSVFTTVGEAISDLPDPTGATVKADYGWSRYRSEIDEVSEYAKRCRTLPHKSAKLGWDVSISNVGNSVVSGNLDTLHTNDVRKRFERVPQGASDPISRYPRLSEDGFCPTLRAGTGKERGSFQAMRPIHFRFPRVITVREAARLQTFPDWFVFHPTKWHSFRMIGNSVPPLVSQHILRVLRSKCGYC